MRKNGFTLECLKQPMTPETPPESPSLEIAHVLFMDIVAYSRLSMDRQVEVTERLREIVRGIPEYKDASARNDLLSLWTGDGMALVFFASNFTEPPEYARRILAALTPKDSFCVRMGIHSGPVYRISDINANRNIAGGGINVAQRVMDSGDAGHILVSKSTADLLRQLNAVWDSTLHDLGEVVVKHGERISIFNYYSKDFGNSKRPLRVPAPPSELPDEPPEIQGVPLKLWQWIVGVLAIIIVLSLLALGGMRTYHYASGLIRERREAEARAEADSVKRGEAMAKIKDVWLQNRAKEMSPNVLKLTLVNKCPGKTLSVAMRFEMPIDSRQWLTMGWWELKPGQKISPTIATSNRRIYYYYTARSSGRTPIPFDGGNDTDPRETQVVDSAFAQETGDKLEGRNPHPVIMRHWDFDNLGQQELPLTCDVQ